MDVFTTSYLRANIIAWLPIRKEDVVCYIGKEEDIIAARLREMSDYVDCIPRLADICGQGRYDYIICLGAVLRGELKICAGCLSESGKLILAAENAYGLKYLAGTKEIGSHAYFGAVEAADGSIGCTKEELKDNISRAGFDWQQFYYPFPDYHFAMSIYSDDYLPKQGELIDQTGNFDAERLVLFDESKAMDAAIARGKFQDFSNSYLAVCGKGSSAGIVNDREETVSFVKFSNDRGESRNIRTYITKSKDGKFHLLKTADSLKAVPQIENIKKTYQALCEIYADARFCVNAYTERENGLEFQFLSGHTMEEELDGYIEKGAYEKAVDRMFEVFQEICLCKGQKAFQMTEEFEKIFGAQDLPPELLCAPVSDIDLIMPNILTDEDGKWTVIDYEWSFHFPIPLNFILYRNIRYYADTTAARRVLEPDRLYEKAKISKQELAVYERMEEAFQAYVLDGHIPMRRLYKESGRPAYHVSSVLHVADDLNRRRALQIYFDRGAGFCEKDTVTYHSKALDGTYHLEIPVTDNVRQIRLDPGSQACTVNIERLSWKNGDKKVLDFISNGHKMTDDMYLFDTDDPNILLTPPGGEDTLLVDLRIDSMSLAAAEWIAPKIDVKYRLKKILKK